MRDGSNGRVARGRRRAVNTDVETMVRREVVHRDFGAFVAAVEPTLRRAFAGHVAAGSVSDALGEAFAYAWQHWDDVSTLANPAAFLFRVGQSRSRRRRQGFPAAPDPARLPHVEPGLAPAMRALPGRQRSVVWLVHGCGWSHVEVADALGISASAVATHLTRGIDRLRTELGVGHER